MGESKKNEVDASNWTPGDVLTKADGRRYVFLGTDPVRGPRVVKLNKKGGTANPPVVLAGSQLPVRLTVAGSWDDDSLQALLDRVALAANPAPVLPPGAVLRVTDGEKQSTVVTVTALKLSALAFDIDWTPASGGTSRAVLTDFPLAGAHVTFKRPRTVVPDSSHEVVGALSAADLRCVLAAHQRFVDSLDVAAGDVVWAWSTFPPGQMAKIRPCIVLGRDEQHRRLLVAPSTNRRKSSHLVVTRAELERVTPGCPDDLPIRTALYVPATALTGPLVGRVPPELLFRVSQHALRAALSTDATSISHANPDPPIVHG